jgi:pimeloyl-ACP methyl ester carboxylesterase
VLDDYKRLMNATSRERTTVRVGGDADLCVEAIGDSAYPAILLIGAATWSMDWWEDELCRRLADRGRLVVRYDHRDTGRSTSYPLSAVASTWIITRYRRAKPAPQAVDRATDHSHA